MNPEQKKLYFSSIKTEQKKLLFLRKLLFLKLLFLRSYYFLEETQNKRSYYFSSIKKARLRLAFSEALGLGNAGKVQSRVFERIARIVYAWDDLIKRLVGKILGGGATASFAPASAVPD